MIRIVIFIVLTLFVQNIQPDVPSSFKVPSRLGPKDFSYDIIDQLANRDGDNTLLAFLANPKFHSSVDQLTFYSTDDDFFTGKILVQNSTKEIYKYNIIFLVDYNQVPVQVEGSWIKSYRLNLDPGKRVVLPIKLKPLGVGAHDFIILIIRTNSNNFVTKNNIKDNFLSLMSYRANIFINSKSFPNKKYYKNNNSIYDDLNDEVSLNKSSDIKNFERLYKESLPIPSIVKYKLHISNYNIEKTYFAMLLFLNSKQVILKNNKNVFFFSQKGKSSRIIDVTLQYDSILPKKLFSVVIDNPFTIIEEGNNRYTTTPLSVRVSNIISYKSENIKNKTKYTLEDYQYEQ